MVEDAEQNTAFNNLDVNALPPPEDTLTLIEVIGEGARGIVYKAKNLKTERFVAVKVVKHIPRNYALIEAEHKALSKLIVHFCFPDYYGTFYKVDLDNGNEIWFAIELCMGGNAAELVQRLRGDKKYLDEKHIAYILKEVLKGLQVLHNEKATHRDVQAANILFTEDGYVRLADLSLSCSLEEDSDSQLHCVGSPWWMAPEVIACNDCNLNYDCRCDVWSLGITAIELADGHPPLENVHFNGVMLKTVRNPPPTMKNPRDWSQIFNDFINECLIWNFDYRPCVEELMKHPFLIQLPKSDTHVTVELQHLIQKTCKQSKPTTFTHRVSVLGSWFVEAWDEEPKWLLIDDVAALHNVTEDAVIKHLGGRFKEHQFYTYCGDILISLNPLVMPNELSEKFYPKYEGKTFSDNPPHLFAVSDRSYQDMLHHQCHQTIVLLGESGSGKSTAASWLLKHLVFLGTNVNPGVNEKLLQIFPILDAFGNARTSCNSTSSRCARHVELTFNRVGKITGATVFMYLLETWRITSIWPGNFNFYVFYYFYDGMRAAGHLKEFGLDVEGPQRHRYLWGMRQDHSDRNKKMFNLLLSSFVSLAFSTEEISTVWNCLAAIILLGDLQFVQVGLVTEVTNTKILEKIGGLLSINEYQLLRVFTSCTSLIRGISMSHGNTVEDAVKKRNIIVRLLYSRLVDWVVNMVTKQLHFSAVVYGDFHSISIADYLGFEDIRNNSFEQLVSNMIAEQNLCHFNRHVFEKEMDDSKMEGIKYPDIQYGDNRPLLDLFFNRPGGILDVVHNVTRQPVTDVHIIESLKNTVSNIKFLADEGLVFVVKHTFDNVTYSVDGFVDKNCEQVPPEAILAFSCSINSKVKEMFTQPLTKTGNLSLKTESTVKVKENNRQRGLWVSSRGVIPQNAQANPSKALNLYQTFSELLTHITKGSPYFVFCIQSNRQSKSNYFSYKDVQSQTSSLNITNTAILKQKGYSHRIPFEEFLKRYQYLTFDFDEKVEITRENCRLLLLRLNLTGWHVGCTKVFMKYYHKEYLSHLYEDHVKKIVKIQALIRAFLARRKKLKEQNSICTNHVSKPMNSKGIDSQNNLHLASVTKENRGDKAAYIIQTYFKKWRIKTMFEVLQTYSATRNAEIIYFSQQVHLYNQEMHHNLYQSQLAVDVIKVKPTVKGYMEALCRALPVRVPKSRTPLRLQDITFEETSHMCETVSLSERNNSILSTVATEELLKMQEEWDTPLNKALPLRFNTKDLIKENIPNNSLIPSTVNVAEETQHDDHNISIDQSQNTYIKPVKGPHKCVTVPHYHGEKPKVEFSSLRHSKTTAKGTGLEKSAGKELLNQTIKFGLKKCNENKPDTTIKTDAEPKTKAYDEDASFKTKMSVTESSMPCINVIKIEEFELMPGILMRGLSAEV
ncbi:neither inactivation nor afterpotential protein C-like isoform X2 [Tachypleus tridentatus]|uniref:neither inactivation nor afterpotential protein C-like isoform X2 n=1 Tax=Tachypleus tridentatus TaxID=6853 RepID=UPI003FD6B3F0